MAHMSPRFLITTADERTWRTDVPVLFLGEWCKLYARRNIWSGMDAEVVPYHWDDRDKLYRDYLYLQDLYEELLRELAAKLNEIHGVDHSLRYWRILSGPWLGYFVQMLFDRWAMIERAMSDYEISGARVVEGDLLRLVPNDMGDFSSLFCGDLWNQAIYAYLLEYRTDVNCERLASESYNSRNCSIVCHPEVSLKQRVKRCIKGIVTRGLAYRIQPHEAFFISDYLPLRQSLKLQWQLGQIPRLWRQVLPSTITVDLEARRWKLGHASDSAFECVLRELIPLQIPAIYLEGYGLLMKQVSTLPWPRRPRFIFTSNSYNSDDVFKAWAAQNVEAGIPLVISQHGGGYGMSQWSFSEEHIIAISDRVLSWGWDSKDSNNIIPTLAIKLAGRGEGDWDPNGNALLVTGTHPRYSYWMYSSPVAGQRLDYFNDQYCFIDALPEEIRKSLVVRLYMHDYGWDQNHRLRKRYPNVIRDAATGPIEPLIRQSRFVIASYNCTTFLETLGRNIPTIIFWNPNHWELRDDAIPYFNLLKEVGIFHETPESAAAKVVEIWDDVPSWWNIPVIQEAREYFCHRFARVVDNPIKVLKDTLNAVIQEKSKALDG